MPSSWIAPRIGIIDTLGYGTEGTIASYVAKGDKSTALIDVGYSTTWENVLKGLGELGVAPESVSHIFLSHFHLDHAGATGSLMSHLPNATVVAHERAIRHLIDPSRLVSAAHAAFGEFAPQLGDMLPVDPARMEPAKEDAYDMGNMVLHPVFTPGHVPSHISVHTDDGVVFSGDAVCVGKEGNPLMIPAASPPVYDVASALASLDTIRSLKPKMILAPHWGRQGATGDTIERHKRTIQMWRDQISAMVDQGLKLDKMTESMRATVLRDSGLKLSDLDDFSRNLLLGRMLAMSVEAYANYALSSKM